MSTQPHIQPNNLYEQDFNAWALDEANKLKLKQFDSVDWSNLIEEIEDMSKREISSLENRLITLIMHYIYQKFIDLFGEPRVKESEFYTETTICI